VLEETNQTEEIVGWVAALDIGKRELVCCVRVPGTAGKRLQEVTTYATMTRSLLVLADRLAELGVTRVVMEATSAYWKPPFYLLEACGLEVWLVNARDVKHLPGRPKTDKLDAVWLAKLAERGMLRLSFVSPPPIRRLRDLTRYPADLVAVRTAEKQRVEKLLEDAQIKLGVVTSDIFGVSGRAMLTRWWPASVTPSGWPSWPVPGCAKLGQLQEAFTGQFTNHHAFLLATMLARVEQASADIAELDRKIEAEIAPFGAAAERLDEITGVGRRAARTIIAEIGVDMGRFPTPGHLASWARFAPGVKQSAGKTKGKSTTGHGNPYLARVVGEAAVAAGKTDTFLGERYRRIARRRGGKKATVAVGRSILVIVWHLLADPNLRHHDLGPGFYDTHVNAERAKRNHIRQLEGLSYKVTLHPPPDPLPIHRPGPASPRSWRFPGCWRSRWSGWCCGAFSPAIFVEARAEARYSTTPCEWWSLTPRIPSLLSSPPDTLVAPARVLLGQSQDQRNQRRQTTVSHSYL
jgi:transposase